MDVRDLVRNHYGTADLGETILRALEQAGTDTENLGENDLFPVDQLHAGGAPATQHLLDRLDVAPGMRLLDVGCGIGGASRMAAMYGAQVTGIDLSPAFVDAATVLTARVGLAERTSFVTTEGESMPFEEASFDAAVMVHVGMNVPDKETLFSEVHRVLRPGGVFGLYEQVRTADGELPYPLPWAEDERSSFVETLEDYRGHLTDAGFTDVEVEDRTASTAGGAPPGPVNNAVVFGPAFVERIRNNISASQAGLLGAWVFLAHG